VKHIVALFLVASLASASGMGVAQDVLSGPIEEGAADLPQDMGLADELPSGQRGAAEELEPIAEPEGAYAGEFSGNYYDPTQLSEWCPSLFESSGTWLRRGFWYAEGDYLWMNRSWDRKGLLFAFQGATSTAPGNQFSGVPGFGPVLTLNTLLIDGSKPGANGMARVTLGRFLFRDGMNRDHNVQVSYYGAGDWKQNSSIQSADPSGIQVNDFIDRINPSFDGADSMRFEYETGLDMFETNYLVKARMGRDQMVLQPDGQWVRSANTSQTYSFLAGVRYVNLTDVLDITATRDPDSTTSQGGNYFVDTDNNLFGGQLGAGIAHETARWSIGMNAKAGSYWNRMHLNSEFLAGPALVPSRGTTDTREDALSFVGEFEVLGKWHLRPNVSLRAGFEVLYVNKVALAPHQVNFIPGGYPPIADDGDIVLLGSAFGIEAYR
jgi:hypothetical protein